MTKIIATLNLPLADNAGEPLREPHDWIVRQLLQHFGGFSQRSELGFWQDPNTGTIYNEAVRVYTVAIDNDEFTASQFRQIAEEAGRYGRQLAVFYTINGVATIAELVL